MSCIITSGGFVFTSFKSVIRRKAACEGCELRRLAAIWKGKSNFACFTGIALLGVYNLVFQISCETCECGSHQFDTNYHKC
jgi:hypothetical protein